MLSTNIKKLNSGMCEVELFKDQIHHFTIDAVFTKPQAEAVCYHIDYMMDRLNYLEPLQTKFEEWQNGR